jgi:CubicO group peptidase (beta-lactamase class C family)
LRYTPIIFLTVLLAGNSDGSDHKVAQALDAHIAGDYNVGAIVSVVEREVPSSWSAGSVELGTNQPPTDQTLFEIGSISKVFTGLILADLVVDGTVKLSDPVSKFVPELAHSKAGTITLVELSTHTSGLPRMPSNFNPSNSLDPYADYTAEDMLDFLQGFNLGDHPTLFDWNNYSNLGVGLLGYVLTRATNMSYEELLADRITGPLGMVNTVVSLSSTQRTDFAKPYNAALQEILPWNLNVLVGAGGIRSNSSDMKKFALANLYPERTPLERALKLTQMVHAENPEKGTKIGLGWGIDLIDGETTYGHNGATGGYRADLNIVPSKELILLSLTNTSSKLQCLKTIVLWNEACTPDFGFPVASQVLEDYVGTYQGPTGLEFVITRRAQYLIYEIVGQEVGRMTALTVSKFHIQGVATMDFMRDEEGTVTTMEFQQGSFTETLQKL